jgi:hypothetical protein
VFEHELVEDIKVKLHGDIRNLVLEILTTPRVENELADPIRAVEQAKQIQYRPGK